MENKAAPDAILQIVKYNFTRICDGECTCSATKFKSTDICRCEGNSDNNAEKFDENEFGGTENSSHEDHHYSDKDLSGC